MVCVELIQKFYADAATDYEPTEQWEVVENPGEN